MMACPRCQTVSPNPHCETGWIVLEHTANALYAPQVTRCHEWVARLHAHVDRDGLVASGLDLAQYQRSWDGLALTHESWRVAKEIAHSIRELLTEGINLVFLGPPGTGKTLAGALVCRAALQAGFRTLAVSWGEFLEGLRDSYHDRTKPSERTQMERLCEVDLLMLDDVGAMEAQDRGGEFSRSRLEAVINKRYAAGKTTLLTANYNATSLRELLGERVASRINARAMLTIFNGPRYRDEEHKNVRALIERIWSEAKGRGETFDQGTVISSGT